MRTKKLNYLSPSNELGYGHAGRNLLLALRRAGVEVAWWPIGRVETPRRAGEVDVLRDCQARAAFYDERAPSLRVWHQFDLAQHVGKGLHCALPIFELDRFRPVELHHLERQDVLFATCEWARRTLVENGLEERKIFLCPLGVDPELFAPSPGPGEGPTTFLNVGKWELRKGHDVLLRAFERAFDPSDEVRLVMACHNPCFADAARGAAYNGQWQSYYLSSPMASRIRVLRERLAGQQQVADLMRTAHCGVFPSRAEGWNLEAAEMLAMGKRVILSACTAHLEYGPAAGAAMVEIDEMEDAHDGVWFRAESSEWKGRPGRWARLGERQVDCIAGMMREVHLARQRGESMFEGQGVQAMRAYGWDQSARKIVEALENA